MVSGSLYCSLVWVFKRLLLDAPDDAWWTTLLFWVTRTITFSLLLRTYIGPWILASLSRHIRVRSISLRSIRGLYIRVGAKTWRVERISYLWSSADGSRKLSVKIDNLNLEVGGDSLKPLVPTSQENTRTLTLADFAPSPIARRLWKLVSSLYLFVDPFLRPFFRTLVVAFLRLIIRWLPDITQALTFDLHSTVVNFADIPGTRIVVEKIHLHTGLGFTQPEKVAPFEEEKEPKPKASQKTSYSMAAWKSRLTDSFHRSWDRAWGKTQGAATISLSFNGVTGLTQPFRGRQSVKFLGLPGATDVNVSLHFNPKKGTVRMHSLETVLSVGECHVVMDALRSLLDSLKTAKQAVPAVNHLYTPDSTAPPPSSPLFEALSVSVRPHRSRRISKLKYATTAPWLSFLASATIHISTIRLNVHSTHDTRTLGVTHEAIFQEVVLGVQLSNPTENPLHCQWLGRNQKIDHLEAEAYSFKFSMHKMTLNRNSSSDDFRLLTLGSIEFQVLVSQWPSPWLAARSFMCGDPNASLLVARMHFDAVEISDDLENVKQLLGQIKPLDQQAADSSLSPSISFPVPQMALELQFGPICGRLIACGSRGNDGRPLTLEMRTSGFTATAHSRFFNHSFSVPRDIIHLASDTTPLRMEFKVSIVIQPTFIRTRSNSVMNNQGHFSNLNASDVDFSDDPALLSTETLQCSGEGTFLADIKDNFTNTAIVDMSSMIFELHCSVDAVCLELWHPDVIAAALKLASVVTPLPRTSTMEPSQPPLLDRLPSGLSATIALARFVIFVTSPNINPEDDMDTSLGFASRTGISVHYCSMHSRHASRFRYLAQRTQTRHKLYLPDERIVEAVSAAKASSITHNTTAFFRIVTWDWTIRSASATHYVTDDPRIAERDDPALNLREFLRVGNVKADINLSGKRETTTSQATDRCDVSVHIPYVRATFQLAHIYSVLLACRTLRGFRPHPSVQQSSSRLSYRFDGTVKTIQVHWTLSRQKLVSRMDIVTTHWSPGGTKGVRWNGILVWVPLPPRINRWQENGAEKWEELLCSQHCGVCLQWSHGTQCISVEGDNARIRIPFGYMPAELVLDASITFKALRHLARVAAAGQYTEIPSPEAEPAKSMPHITVRMRCLWLEASDDAFESKLGVIWRAGFDAAKHRLDREEAFSLKVAKISVVDSPGRVNPPQAHELESDYTFSSKHSVSVEEARQRLNEVHALDWTIRLNLLQEKRAKFEEANLQRFRGKFIVKGSGIPNLVQVAPAHHDPPLFRAVLNDISLSATPPSFSPDGLPGFLQEHGHAMPRDTQFSLLLPMHIKLTLSSLRVTLRDYPLPLVDILPHANTTTAALEFETDIVIAEEMGSVMSVDWTDCPVFDSHHGVYGIAPLSISVPKTIMPVKSYANPVIRVLTSDVTSFSWGVSYGPATQDLMRIAETLNNSPRDSSPNIGFWDKLRLVFHWSITASFKAEARLYMKGSRDPYRTIGNGAGFVLSWQGDPKLFIAHENDNEELIQVISDSMFIAIPNLDPISLDPLAQPGQAASDSRQAFRKICAKFRSGVRFGVGFVMERSCNQGCSTCRGTPFQRACRLFNFRPHHEVRLEKKVNVPELNGPTDSYSGFRSDFIHMSISLASSTHNSTTEASPSSSSLHLTPKAFAHFWSWWGLFDSVLSLPVRQGTYYPPRVLSPKLGYHLATLKYRIVVPRIFVLHAYIDDSRETWTDGVTPFVGVKAMIDELQADMHQRDQDVVVPGLAPGSTRILRRKLFYAAEVVLKGIDLRAMLAIFSEPLKKRVPVRSFPLDGTYRTRHELPATDPLSIWNDSDDFIETDWSSFAKPTVHFLPVMACHRFTYFKRNSSAPENQGGTSKFGAEKSHRCFLGEEPSVPQVQASLALARISQLKEAHDNHRECAMGNNTQCDDSTWKKRVALLEEYITLQRTEKGPDHATGNGVNYHIPSDTVSPDEWAEFDNVYHVHCPKVFMNRAIRDIMMQYYHCSRSRRGLEYHMATRAVKFIRDQAALATDAQINTDKSGVRARPAQAAAMALRKIFAGDSSKSSVDISDRKSSQSPGVVDPLDGWDEGVSPQKSHCCLLLKPQVVLHSEGTAQASCVVAAVQAKLQSYAIMDNLNANDPVSGIVMSRSYTSLSGLQTFSPTNLPCPEDGGVPLEVLIDFRCDSGDFDRLVPQTEATFHYDKFNRLRLRNSVTSVARANVEKATLVSDNHLQDQTDLLRIHIPRFTVTANDQHFQAISNIVTELLLFSDAAYKTRLEKLETMLFTYDFTDIASAAGVVAELQGRLRNAIETERIAGQNHFVGGDRKLELLKLQAHIFLLTEELNFLFDAIKLAQDRFDDQNDRKSALLLHASSSEISWRMLDDQRDLLAKLVVRDIDYYWLSRQDSSTVNTLAVGDLQAFDGSQRATWAEILCKYNEPPNHPLLKRGLFVLADWIVLPPVGGITIYEEFQLRFHPMRLQIDSRVGRRIMEYLWPARRSRQQEIDEGKSQGPEAIGGASLVSTGTSRPSLDYLRTANRFRKVPDEDRSPPLRRLKSSRSFTDLSSASLPVLMPKLKKTRSSEVLRQSMTSPESTDGRWSKTRGDTAERAPGLEMKAGDAAQMKTRLSQKSFVFVRISSLNLLLSVMKEESFVCRDARIRTRDLEYRNQTWSFEELVDQFIPSDMSWKGWIKVAFHQPLIPVLPVAREIISKTKWIASSKAGSSNPEFIESSPIRHGEIFGVDPGATRSPSRRTRTTSSKGVLRGPSETSTDLKPDMLSAALESLGPPSGRKRVLSLFSRSTLRLGKSIENQVSSGSPSSEETARGTSHRRSDSETTH